LSKFWGNGAIQVAGFDGSDQFPAESFHLMAKVY